MFNNIIILKNYIYYNLSKQLNIKGIIIKSFIMFIPIIYFSLNYIQMINI